MKDGPNRSHIPDRVVALLAATPPFDRLTPELREQLLADLLVEYFDADEQILPQAGPAPEHLYVVESGSVRLVDNTNHRLVDLCGEGDTFGAVTLLKNDAMPYEAIAAEPTVCALVPAARFRALCETDKRFADFFAGNLRPSTRAIEPALDGYGSRLLFTTRMADLVRRKPLTCPPDTAVRDAARLMQSGQVESILVVEDNRAIGILTDTDLRNKVVAEGASVDTPVAQLMNSPVFSLGPEALVLDALLQMSKRRIHHLVVTAEADPASKPLGVLSEQDIAHANGQSPAATVKRLEKARSVGELVRIRAEPGGHLLRLYRQGVQPEDLMEVVTEINDCLTARLLHLVEASLILKRPNDRVDLRWAWMSFGSEGRREMGLTADQDNALIYEDPSDPAESERAEQWFATIARRANTALAECGFPLCKGWVMASNIKWRQPLSQWKRIFRGWVLEPEPKALMHASIFFDLRALYGHAELVDDLKDDLRDALRRERGFLAFLTHNALNNRPPLSFFRRFLVDHSGKYGNTFDLKLHGLMPLIDLARVLALEGQFLESTNTFDRLAHAGERLPDARALTANATDAFRYLLDLRMGHHLNLLEAGQKPNNHIDPEKLSKTQQRMLRAVFSTVGDMQESLELRHGAHMMHR